MRVSPKLFKRSGVIKPTVWIGKEGVTPQLLDQIKIQLKVNEMVKAKVQRSSPSSESLKDLAEKAAKETSSTLIDSRGRTFTLYKKAKRT